MENLTEQELVNIRFGLLQGIQYQPKEPIGYLITPEEIEILIKKINYLIQEKRNIK
jgi:hypothetical protein